MAPSVEEERAAGVVLIREYEADRDREAVENLERMCEVGPSDGGGMSLFTDLLGDPLCRVRHSPSFLMLVRPPPLLLLLLLLPPFYSL